MRLNSLHYFRGIAILFIVVGHCIGLSGYQMSSPLRKLFANLLYGGTALFVFISGFLFHHVYYKKFNYKDFLVKKVKHVVLPYLVFSVFLLLYYLTIRHDGPFLTYFSSADNSAAIESFRLAALCLLTGATNFAYWYIPFIMVVFAASPLLIHYIRLSLRAQIVIFCSLYLIALIVHRPVNNILVLQSVVYFLPVYLLGIIASIHKEDIYARLEGKELYLLLILLSLAMYQVVFYDNFLNFHKNPLVVSVLDINLIQKTILCIFFMVWLHRFEEAEFASLGALADASFPIYFIHPIVLLALLSLLGRIFTHQTPLPFKIMLFPVVVAISYGFAFLLKNTLRSKSRYVIGW
jgi:probable poly-beta-1,6-N-acetyl-D-glucosamine export protein